MEFLTSIRNQSGRDYLIWKYPKEDFNTNSVLTVNPGEKAILIKNGDFVHTFTSGRYELQTENYPFLSDLRNLLSNGSSTFTCSVFFVNVHQSTEILWGTSSPIQLRDPVQGIATNVRARGSYRVQVVDGECLLRNLIGASSIGITGSSLDSYFCQQFQQIIKSEITKALINSNKEVLGMCANLGELASDIEPHLQEILKTYGIKLEFFAISGMDIPEGDPNRMILEQAYAKKQELHILGESYGRVIGTEILTNFSKNEGTGTMAAAGFGINACNDLSKSITELVSNNSANSNRLDIDKLKQLKIMLDERLITQADYDSVKNEILTKIAHL